jgi:hypothetical protein
LICYVTFWKLATNLLIAFFIIYLVFFYKIVLVRHKKRIKKFWPTSYSHYGFPIKNKKREPIRIRVWIHATVCNWRSLLLAFDVIYSVSLTTDLQFINFMRRQNEME